MDIFYFVLSVTISLGAVAIFRYLDRNNRSFERLHRLQGKVKDDLDKMIKEKIDEIKSLDDSIDVSLDKGASMLKMLNDNITVQTKHLPHSAKTEDENLVKRIAELEKMMADGSESAGMRSPGAINKSLKKMLKESDEEIKSLKSDIKKMREDVEAEKKNFSISINEANKSAFEKINGFRKEIETYITDESRVFKKSVVDITNEVNRIDERMGLLKSEHLESYKKDLMKADSDEKKRITEIRDELDKLITETNKNFEAKINDYSAYFARLEARVDDYKKKTETELETEKNKKILDLNLVFTNKMKEIETYNDKVKVEARTNINKIVKSYEEKYENLNKDFYKITEETQNKVTEYETFLKDSSGYIERMKQDIMVRIEEKQKEIDIHVNNARELGENLELKIFENIKKNLTDFSSEMNGKIAGLSKEYSEKFALLDNDIVKKIEKIEGDIESINGSVDNNRIFLSEYQGSFRNKIAELNDGMSKFIADYNSNIEILKSGSEEKIASIRKYFDAEKERNLTDINALFNKLTDDAGDKSRELGVRFEDRYKEVEGKLIEIQNNMIAKSSEIEGDMIKKGNELKSGIINKQESIEKEINERMNSFMSDLVDKSKLLNDEVAKFEAGFKKYIDDFNVKIDDNKSKLAKIENDYFVKGNELLDINEKKIESTDKYLGSLRSELDILKKTIDDDMVKYVAESKASIEQLSRNGMDFIRKSYGELESETIQKIENYKTEMGKIKSSIKSIEEKHESLLSTKLLDMDKRFDVKLDTFSEKYRIHIGEIYDKTEQIDKEFNERMDLVSKNYEDKTTGMINSTGKELDSIIKRFNDLNQSLNFLKGKIDDDVAAKIENGKISLNEQYNILETDTVKKINDYKKELLTIKQNIYDLNETYELRLKEGQIYIDDRLKEKIDAVDSQYDRHIAELKDKIRIINDEFKKLNDEQYNNNKLRFDNFSSDFKALGDDIKSLKSHLDSDIAAMITSGVENVKATMNDAISKSNDIFKVNETGIISQLEVYKKDFVKIQANMKVVDERFTAKYIEHSSILDKRIAMIEAEIKKFEKHSYLFEKAGSFKEKLNEEIAGMNDSIEMIKSYKADLNDMVRKVEKVKELSDGADAKYNEILNGAKRLDNIEVTIKDLKMFIDEADEKLQVIKESKTAMASIEDKLYDLSNKISNMDKLIIEFSGRESKIRSSFDSLSKMDVISKELDSRYNLLNKKYDDLRFKEETYEKTFKDFEKDAFVILKSQDKIYNIIDKFNQMDNLVIDLETRSAQINKSREWLVKAETHLENLNDLTDKKIKTLESLLDKSEDNESGRREGGDEKETVLRLQKQGWTIDDIAKSLSLSVGEVEFILDLELNTRKNR